VTTELLSAVAAALDGLGAEVLSSDDIGAYAVELALGGWAVLPLRGKVPAIPGPGGVLDATSDIETVIEWWSGPYAGCNIGARVPASLFVLDVDPRKSGCLEALADLLLEHGPLPTTLTAVSGRGDWGRHLYYRHPGGKLSAARLPEGLDLKTSSGYCVVPPSIHPATGQPYTWVQAPMADPPSWMVDLLRPEVATPPPPPPPRPSGPLQPAGTSIADTYSAAASWADILAGWRCLSPDPDAEGARWRHPTATSPVSATVRHGCLFVYSPNTSLPVTEAGNPAGLTRFRAYSLLHHRGDLSAAARALQGAP
jgi:hypothetical protein